MSGGRDRRNKKRRSKGHEREGAGEEICREERREG